MKFKPVLVKQDNAMQCGAACLTMALRGFGKFVDISAVEEMCGSGRDGVSLLALKHTAESFNLEVLAATCTAEDLLKAGLPAILFWDNRHYVLFYGANKNRSKFYVLDPQIGKIKYTQPDFMQHWATRANISDSKGVALFLCPDENFAAMRPVDSKRLHNFRFALGYVKPYRKYLVHVLAGMMLASVLQLALPFLTQAIVDKGIRHKDISLIWLILLGELLIVLGRTLTDFIRRWLLLHVSLRINLTMVSDFFMKLLRLPMDFCETRKTGDLIQRIGDHGRIQSFLSHQLLSVSFSAISFVIFGIVLLIYSRLIFLIFIIGGACYAAWLAIFLHRRKTLDYELFAQLSRDNSKTYQFITAIQEIKLQGCQQRRRQEWENVQVDAFNVRLRSLKLEQTQEAGAIFINEVKNVLITVFAATAVIHGQMTLGAMLAVQYIVGQLNSPLDQIVSFVYSLQDARISLDRIHEIHAKAEKTSQGLVKIDTHHAIDINVLHVSHKYDKHSTKLILNDLNIKLPHGKVTAVVGHSGSGKSTLLKLLLGYYKPVSGVITINGISLDKLDLDDWRRQCGVVMQDGVIFTESIARNIANADGEIDIDKLEKAARIAQIHDFVMQMPMQYNTVIGPEGAGLSQGQKQRILIARAVYKQPRILILDEATNSLDAANERQIVKNLGNYYRGRTVIIVAHRLSTVREADQIIVLENGQITEVGNHEELIDNKSAYFNLVRNQLELPTA